MWPSLTQIPPSAAPGVNEFETPAVDPNIPFRPKAFRCTGQTVECVSRMAHSLFVCMCVMSVSIICYIYDIKISGNTSQRQLLPWPTPDFRVWVASTISLHFYTKRISCLCNLDYFKFIKVKHFLVTANRRFLVFFSIQPSTAPTHLHVIDCKWIEKHINSIFVVGGSACSSGFRQGCNFLFSNK